MILDILIGRATPGIYNNNKSAIEHRVIMALYKYCILFIIIY